MHSDEQGDGASGPDVRIGGRACVLRTVQKPGLPSHVLNSLVASSVVSRAVLNELAKLDASLADQVRQKLK